ncbi:hypothetical protein KW796_02820 [Candidatus Parcubacteria bacterium]|nr:hypothetical protein [Candidatus Parcubacteria bacterium]
MSITEEFSFDKEGEVVRFPHLRRYFLASVIILIALLSFGVGRLTGGEREGVTINYDPNLAVPAAAVALSKPRVTADTGHSVFASSKGKRYYYPGCRNTISEKNKVTFATETMAEKAGYTLASGCKKP